MMEPKPLASNANEMPNETLSEKHSTDPEHADDSSRRVRYVNHEDDERQCVMKKKEEKGR